ncbi:MAG: alpha/beta hydrolase [Clostridia bacterium]|nr:alpha/beta hydrolase [Clostridia bacterium]
MIKEERISIVNDVKIGATIAYKDKSIKRPLVLLIMGTGSLDRDGNGFGFKSNMYKELSDMFVEFGCVCVRYDKRGTHESTGDGKTSGLSELVNDAINVINYAKKLEYVDEQKVIACGHSEGAMIATLITKTEKIQGIILLSGAGMGLKDAMLYQNGLIVKQAQSMKGFLGWYLRKALRKVNIEKQVSALYEIAEKSDKPRFFYRGAFLSTKYMKEHNALSKENYVDLLKAYNGKILALTGKNDIQADYTALEPISKLKGATVYTPERLNHVLREISGEANLMNIKKEYKAAFKSPISAALKELIKNWLSQL